MNPALSPYTDILNNAPKDDKEALVAFLSAELPDLWYGDYEAMTFTDDYPYSLAELDIVSITLDKLTYLYDMGNAYDEGDPQNPRVESRVVAVYGCSQLPRTNRDTSRMRGWLGPSGLRGDGNYDKGHFIAHMAGGGLDINLFFQRRDINRGWSERGKVYRRMERYCAEHLGAFCFSRPQYHDRTWQPCAIEYGILLPDSTLWVEWFEN
ncbi:hypothetical protein [Aggregatilinea lenta]|uniref:hypothetical protein n=1 Tax=Aggregatilinea lenta TaxID=913108 RepID=UPI0013C2A1DE|nr:hypothetical protein [Aggregatilinea lenta]